MTAVMPGSAQLAAGDKRVGRLAIRCWILSIIGLLALVAVGLASRTELVTLFTSLWFLRLLRLALVIAALGFAYLIIDAWRLSEPMRLSQGQRLTMTGLNGVVCLAVTGALLFASHYVAVQKDFIARVFGSTTVTAAEHGRYNVLLLGGDAGADRVGLRPDSITVASIDADTGRTVLFGLPRNLQNVPFPDGTAMHAAFPNGFNCAGCYLNAIYTSATDHPDRFPGVADPGIEATKEAVETTTGLDINYYVMIDLRGFQDLVDALGGVTVTVNERLPIGGIAAPVTGYVEPGRRHLDGYQTLWFARSRTTSDDYSRMARQKCVMNAMLHQLNPAKVLTRFSQIAKASEKVISTSIPASEIGRFVSLADKARSKPVTTVSFVPPRINGYDPDFTEIRSMVSSAIKTSEAKDSGGSQRHRHHKSRDVYAANDSANLDKTC